MKAVVFIDLIDYTVKVATTKDVHRVVCKNRDDTLQHIAELLDAGFTIQQVDNGMKVLMIGELGRA